MQIEPFDPLQPAPGEFGRAQSHLDLLLDDVLTAWDLALAALDASADTLDPGDFSARRGHSIREVLITIGEWPGGANLADRRAAAMAGDVQPPPQGMIDAEIDQRFGRADLARIRTAWQAARDSLEAWIPHAPAEAGLHVGSPLGVIPLGTLVSAGSVATYRALRDANITVDPELPRIALHALVDSVGAVCAQAEPGVDYRLAVLTPDLQVVTSARDGSWRTARPGPTVTTDSTPRMIGPTEVVLEITTGRRSPVTAVARREIEVVDVAGLLRIARGLSAAPDLPGGDGLRAAFAALDGVGSTASAITRGLRRIFPR